MTARVMSKAEYLATVKRAGGNPQQVTTEGMTAHIWGTTAIVTGIYGEKGVALKIGAPAA